MKRKMTIESIITFIYTFVLILAFIFIYNTVKNTDEKIVKNEIYREISRTNTYINTLLQKNDKSNKIFVVKNPFDESKNALKIIDGPKNIFIFSKDENIYELYYTYSQTPSLNNALLISENIIFNVSINENNLLTYYLKHNSDIEILEKVHYFIKSS